MPAELWDLEAWPSPSAEAVLRRRVRRRARGILRWRVAAVSMVVVSALTAVVSDLPGGKAPRRVEVYDSRVVDAEAPAMPGVGATPPAAGSGGLVRAPGDRASAKSAVAPAPAQGAGPAPAHVWPVGPVVPDAAGDATSQAGCASVNCPGDARMKQESDRMFDLTSLGLPCSDRGMSVRFNVADLDRPPANGDSVTPDAGNYHAGIFFNDDRYTMVSLFTRRDIDTDTFVPGGQFAFIHEDEGYSGDLTTTAYRDGDTVVVELAWSELARALGERVPGMQPPVPGTPLTAQAATAAIVYMGVANAQMLQMADEIKWQAPEYPYSFCQK